jgi:hypothetical protein
MSFLASTATGMQQPEGGVSIMQHIRTQPAGPKAFRLYSMVRDTYRSKIGERAFSVYEALTYYVDPKTLQGAIPLKLLAETAQSPLTTVSRCLHRLWQEGLITITPQWDDFGCVPKANLYILHALPCTPMAHQSVHMSNAALPVRRHQMPRLTLLRRSGDSRPHKDMPA